MVMFCFNTIRNFCLGLKGNLNRVSAETDSDVVAAANTGPGTIEVRV